MPSPQRVTAVPPGSAAHSDVETLRPLYDLYVQFMRDQLTSMLRDWEAYPQMQRRLNELHKPADLHAFVNRLQELPQSECEALVHILHDGYARVQGRECQELVDLAAQPAAAPVSESTRPGS